MRVAKNIRDAFRQYQSLALAVIEGDFCKSRTLKFQAFWESCKAGIKPSKQKVNSLPADAENWVLLQKVSLAFRKQNQQNCKTKNV